MPKIIKTKKLSNKNYNIPTLYALAVIKGLIVLTFGTIFCSVMVLRSAQSNFFYYSFYMFLVLGALLCGYDASKKIKGRGFVKGVISSGIYCAIIIGVSIVLMRFNVSTNILLLLPLSLLPGFFGGILAVK